MDLTDRIGCVLTPEGAFFRVWAPHATAVSVAVQDGPEWDAGRAATAQALKRAADDYWSATVPGVAPGQLYRFRITTAEGEVLERLDAAARDVLSSELTRAGDGRNASLVPDRGPHTWAPFDPPRFENFLVYQFHVGTFAGRGDEHGVEWATFEQVESKLGYIKELGFSCVEPLPVQEYAMDRSWGYHPATWFAPESSYGSPASCGTSSTPPTAPASR